MAAENDETFFDGVLPNLLTGEKKVNESQTDGSEVKAPRKSTQKENISEKTETKKTGRTSNTKREPLKAVNNTERVTNDGKKEKEVKNKVDPSLEAAGGKKTQTIPKIVVFQDGTKEAKGQNNKKKPVRRMAKSCDDARRSLPGKTPKLGGCGRKVRHSISDPGSVKADNKAKKLSPKVGEGKKSPKSTAPQPEFDQNLSKLKVIFSTTDPGFLKSQLTKFKGSLQETMEFLLDKETNLPVRPDNPKEVHETYKESFVVEDFVKMFPNPWEHFSRTDVPRSSSYIEHSLYYLKNKYRKHYVQAIQEALARNQNNLYLADKELSKKNRLLRMRTTNRSRSECEANKPETFDVQFVQEVAFIENEKEIKSHLKKAEMGKHKKFKEAEKSENLLECLSCNNFSLLQDDAVNCPAHHVFCKDCLIKYVAIEMGKDDFRFKCLMKCEEAFPVETLQRALTPPIVAEIITRNQSENIKPEGIENLAYCPFCCHIFISPAETTVIKCVSPTCALEFCRKCKKGSHVPWNCGEIMGLTPASLEGDEKEKSEDGKEEVEQDAEESGLFLTFEPDRGISATICSVCQQPGCSHACDRSSWSLSFSSDSTEYAEIVTEDD